MSGAIYPRVPGNEVIGRRQVIGETRMFCSMREYKGNIKGILGNIRGI